MGAGEREKEGGVRGGIFEGAWARRGLGAVPDGDWGVAAERFPSAPAGRARVGVWAVVGILVGKFAGLPWRARAERGGG